jgi:hypothetical protein
MEVAIATQSQKSRVSQVGGGRSGFGLEDMGPEQMTTRMLRTKPPADHLCGSAGAKHDLLPFDRSLIAI